MELNSLVEELLRTPKIDTNLNPFPNLDYFPNYFDQAQDMHFPPSELSNPCFLEAFTLPDFSSFYDNYVDYNTPLPIMENQEDFGFNLDDSVLINGFDDVISSFVKDESGQLVDERASNYVINVGNCSGEEKKNSVRKINGQSKNLMAERRRRKRLNDRLSMLRSIVPKISKMDRTSILGDTIDYAKELLDKIHKLKEENNMDETLNHINYHFKEHKPNEMLVRNPTKFHVERTNHETRVEVCCMAKPGLLISTLGALDALGLDIQQCVISCFNDFSLRASCHEVAEYRSSLMSCEDIKQVLLKSVQITEQDAYRQL
ncbi:hypothetical protein CASFOL_015348 [Castilleja foliolosa]|uniref:BHLH domain-containing protein n=1 Tax=Castilleja foliolosa TaxID=1961234 RepID=A0ABD3DDF2_9LAMI